MNIDTPAFAPGAALARSLLIGLAVAVFVLFNGRVAGISGILSGLFLPRAGDIGWRLAFIGGLIGAPLIYALFWHLPKIQIEADPVTLILAEVMVGFGTRIGSGCISGHGMCEISRLLFRSIVQPLFLCRWHSSQFIWCANGDNCGFSHRPDIRFRSSQGAGVSGYHRILIYH